MKRCTKKRAGGFMLVELLIVLLIIGIVIDLAYQFFFQGYRSFAATDSSAKVQQSLQLLISRMDSEVRNAVVATTQPGTAIQIVPPGQQLDIYTYLEGDTRPVRVTYKLIGTSLKRYQSEANNSSYPYQYPNLPPDSDSSWQTMVAKVNNNGIFSEQPKIGDNYTPSYASGSIVKVTITADDPDQPLPVPIMVDTVLSVRNQGGKAI